MNKQKSSFSFLLLLYGFLALLSVGIKCVVSLQPTEITLRESQQNQLIQTLQSTGLQLKAQHSLAPGGALEILAFSHPDCPSYLYVLPMYRNAEAQNLLRKTLGTTVSQYGYFYRKNFKNEFPTWSFWLHEKLLRHLGLSTSSSAFPVISYAEKDNCNHHRKLSDLSFTDQFNS